MGFMDSLLWGVHLWVWLYLGLSVVLFISVAMYFYREVIRKKYYDIRFPEKVLRIVIHYKSGYFKEYWRLVPDNDFFVIDKKQYQFNDSSIKKENDFFIEGKAPKQIIRVDGKEYQFDNLFSLKNRWKKYPEIHYIFNKPSPLNFDLAKDELDFTASQLEEFKENDLFKKLLTLDTERSFLMFILFAVIINLVGTIFIIAKIMEWIA